MMVTGRAAHAHLVADGVAHAQSDRHSPSRAVGGAALERHEQVDVVASALGRGGLVGPAVGLSDPHAIADSQPNLPLAFDRLLETLGARELEEKTLRARRRRVTAVGVIEREVLLDGEVLDRRPREAREIRLDGAPSVGGKTRARLEQQNDQERAEGPTHASLIPAPRRRSQ